MSHTSKPDKETIKAFNNALVAAAANGELELAQILLDHGANVNKQGISPIIVAIRGCKLPYEMVEERCMASQNV